MKNFWCKKLRLAELLYFWAYGQFMRVTIRYEEQLASSSARRLLLLLQGYGLLKNFKPADLDYDVRDESGHSLIYEVNDDLKACCEEFLEAYAPSADERYRQLVKTHMRVNLEGQITFVKYANAKIIRNQIDNNTIFVEPSALNTTLSLHFGRKGISLDSVLSIVATIREYILVPLAFVSIHLFAKLRRDLAQHNIFRVRPAIWVEYHDNRFSMDASWRQHLDSKEYDQVQYFDREDSRLTKERMQVLETEGQRWIDLQRPSLFKLGNISVTKLSEMLVDLYFGRASHPPWYSALQFQERLWYHCYLAVFTKFQVKILIQNHDRNWRQAVQASAIEKAGGILLGSHYSNLPYTMDNWFLNSQHVYFVWGKAQYDSTQIKGHTITHILPSGFWFKPAYDDRPAPQLEGLRGDLDFVISVFDSAVLHSCLMSPFQTPEAFSAFCSCILTLLENNSHWGAILKFRTAALESYTPILPDGAGIIRRFSALMEQERVVELNHRVSPVAAAACSNLSVCFPLNSAGIIAGIFGHRAIHWDHASHPHIFYNDPGQKILFQTLSELEDAIGRAAKGDKAIGDFTKWLPDFNYFSDFEGDKRIAMFVQSYMTNCVTMKALPAEILEVAVNQYREYCRLPANPFGN